MGSLSILKDSLSVFCTIGNHRSSNEDRYHIELLSFGEYELLFIGIFDGHGGSKCSNFLKENITKYFQFTDEDLSDIEKLKKSITSSCLVINQIFFATYPDDYDGSCALMSFLLKTKKGYHLLVANVGDSMGLVLKKAKKRKLDYSILNKLHKPFDPHEKARLEESGFVVINDRFLGLAVSRAFGDQDLAEKGITCIPEFRDCEITKKFRYMVLASDGLWDVVTEEKVLELIHKDNANSEILTEYALENESMDNVTVIICNFASLFN
ncbi:MAG: protein serine/threonine phosphatase 2C family protein [Candidatus Heimdallarchaeota archaeon]|nr:protein serine/threonine phosphatase 2C family protein [Candidatus Heimdallarchaeota archaeon]